MKKQNPKQNFNSKEQDILKILKMLGLNINGSTGGCYKNHYQTETISKNKLGMYMIEENDKKIVFLTGSLFISTVKMVEKSLKYKLFH